MAHIEEIFSAYEQQTESFSSVFISNIKDERLTKGKENLLKTDSIVFTLLEGNENVTIDKLRENIQKYETDDKTKGNIYLIFSEKIIYFLDEDVAKLRLERQRATSSARLEALKKEKEEAKKQKRSKGRTKQQEPEAEDYSVHKMSLEEMGADIVRREEEDKKRKEVSEEEDKRVEEIGERHAYGYQSAFQLYADYIALMGKDRKGIQSISDTIAKLGNKDLSVRQMAIDRLLTESNLDLAYFPLVTSLKDKVIINKVIQALGNVSNFEIVETLIDIFIENYGEKGSGLRGLSAQSIGKIIKNLNGQEKLLGTKKIYSLVKEENFEKKLVSILPYIKKDVTSSHMRKYYYSNECIQLILMLCNKLIQLKLKEVKAGFIKFNLQTPLSKELKDLSKELESALQK